MSGQYFYSHTFMIKLMWSQSLDDKLYPNPLSENITHQVMHFKSVISNLDPSAHSIVSVVMAVDALRDRTVLDFLQI